MATDTKMLGMTIGILMRFLDFARNDNLKDEITNKTTRHSELCLLDGLPKNLVL